MLDNITKKNIDNCRDVLVGKVPDPKSQIEQITLALIYKFMDDMDKESIDLGGMPKFFTGDYEKFGWRKLFDPSLGGKEVLDLYSEALDVLQTNANLPELFRNIFKNAYLPYRDPSTLKMFLKYINEFEYSHSEKLGDAFEYLLSVMGSQGDAGQFRTPRHVIDFIAACLNPQKHETVADPACGTAGFLLSAYKHILQNNTDKRLGDKLTPDDRKKLADNFYGYDISPDMVRLSLVNMYLHGFTTPKIFEYDTLSSEDRWNETFDVILANPPFMTPKGGIRPHKKFGVQANKAEVLFTDYIAEHLSKNGRAGIVVPNGIVATTQTAYKQLRKMLVDDSLIAVVSLPAGCFNPYSGVKTSILMLDKSLAKKNDYILFIKVENDGFDLGAQRREHEKNDLPLALEAFNAYKKCISSGNSFDEEKYSSICDLIEKKKILANKDLILGSERYKESNSNLNDSFDYIQLKDICDIQNGYAFKSDDYVESSNTLNFRMSNIRPNGILDLNHNQKYLPDNYCTKYSDYLLRDGDVVIAMTDMATEVKILGVPTIIKTEGKQLLLNQRVGRFKNLDMEKIHIPFLKWILIADNVKEYYKSLGSGGLQINIGKNDILSIDIPLPPLEIQEQIVKEIKGYQKIIDGAKMVVDNYKPTITIKSEWEMVELGKVCDINSKASEPTKLFGNELFTYIDIESVENGTGILSFNKVLNPKEAPSRARRVVKNGDVALSTVRPNLRAFAYLENLPENCLASTGFAILSANNKSLGKYLYYSVHQDYMVEQMISKSDKGQYPSVTASDVKELEIYLPTIEEQESIVQNLEAEQQLVASNKQLIFIFEQKIKNKINEVWGVKEEVSNE
jgi:type I restriction enzyme M protein